MSNIFQFLMKENIVSITDLQRNPLKSLHGVTRIMRHGKTFGFFFDPQEYDEMREMIEMLTSRSLDQREELVNREIKKGKYKTLTEIAKKHGT